MPSKLKTHGKNHSDTNKVNVFFMYIVVDAPQDKKKCCSFVSIHDKGMRFVGQFNFG